MKKAARRGRCPIEPNPMALLILEVDPVLLDVGFPLLGHAIVPENRLNWTGRFARLGSEASGKRKDE
jgi:hypothetical protein